MNIGDVIKLTRIYQGMEIDTLHGLILSLRPLKPIHDRSDESFTIKLLETNGSISDIVLGSQDEIEVLNETWTTGQGV